MPVMTDRAVIIGAGPAGLTAAWELGRLGRPAIVLEKSTAVGGLSRTVCRNGYHFDIGGHRFFTKVPEVRALWREWLGEDLLERPRMSRIYYRGRFFDYPLRPFDALTKLGPVEAVRIVLSYLRARLVPQREQRNLEQWVVHRFGRRLYEIFFRSYTEKVWGLPCTEIDAEWAAQRIKNLDLLSALRSALMGGRSGGQVITTLIERFSYPRLGPGMMWEVCRDKVQELGIETLPGAEVRRICHQGDRVRSVIVARAGGEEELRGADFISSMPIRDLVAALDPPPPEKVLEAAARLRYRDFLTVVLIVDRESVFPDNWIYVHAPEVQVGRVQNFKNWSPEMVPDQALTSLGLEYFVQEGDELWCSSDTELRDLGAREMEELGLIRADEVIGHEVVRAQKAYPVYDSAYAEALEIIRAHLGGLRNLQLIGRNGQHRYNNQDHSMVTGLLAARNLTGAGHDLWSVNVEQIYHEEGIGPAGERLAPTPAAEPEFAAVLGETFARYDPVALGGAVGVVAGLGLFAATAVLLLRGGEPLGPRLSLLGQYFFGYGVSWEGALAGLFEAGVGGFAFGWVLARLINRLVDLSLASVIRRWELSRSLDPLDRTNGPNP